MACCYSLVKGRYYLVCVKGLPKLMDLVDHFISRSQPLVLALDDLHWADESSL